MLIGTRNRDFICILASINLFVLLVFWLAGVELIHRFNRDWLWWRWWKTTTLWKSCDQTAI